MKHAYYLLAGSLLGFAAPTLAQSVGVNTTVPALTVDVTGTSAATGATIGLRNYYGTWDHLYFFHDGSTAYLRAGGADTGLAFQVGTAAGGSYGDQPYTDVLRLLPSGNVGIGTSAPNAPLQFSNGLSNRKVVLFEGANNDHQFIGLGVNNGVFRYQLASTSDAHVFYGASGAATSEELLRIAGTGQVLMKGSFTAGRNAAGNSNNGVNSYSATGVGVYGYSSASAGGGVLAEGAYIGVQGTSTGTNSNRQAVRGDNAGSSTGYAGVFTGTVAVFGTLSKTAGSFQIDHPIDPANKYLVHSFVESPDMKNIYDGIVTTDATGSAAVTMPEWFQSLNIDFRYQLTCMGQFAQAIIAREMQGNQFIIKTDKPNVKVSWQVTGTRNDPYARDNRLPVEKAKRPDEKGKYIYPQGYGLGQESALDVISGSITQEP